MLFHSSITNSEYCHYLIALFSITDTKTYVILLVLNATIYFV